VNEEYRIPAFAGGQAMIRTVTQGYEKQILEVKDIVALAGRGIQNIE
jgi:hypothetical protein